ncbi:MAG: winged helix DNA-binding protein [Rhodobiaceae bacterium]|nr:winged helix DNA-binding protein [Rhodobiaceae bacterium]MCC0017077.1 winged helix DNA-binding protein [Rhodobiaceae bacterium]MCC0040844.1 winged helix DNA-binding protein [Rhodobiaceae bacterium]MCC0053670.1 winged helix DNA-binding protein [Rhodobiaceae bacterium]
MSRDSRPLGPIVSSSHLASSKMPALSELEFALTMANNAFSRWIVRCAAAAGAAGLTPLEVLVLHSVTHRDRPKTLADLCLVLNVEDTHLVTYAVKKLEKTGLVEAGKRGKEKTIAVTRKGQEVCTRYGEVRAQLLIESLRALGLDQGPVSELSDFLRALSGQYDQAARTAASL